MIKVKNMTEIKTIVLILSLLLSASFYNANCTTKTADVTLSYLLEKNANVELIITDMLGNEIRHIHCSKRSKGNHDEIIDISNLSEGTYLCGVITEDGVREMTRIVIAH